jgi:hypothetical protein
MKKYSQKRVLKYLATAFFLASALATGPAFAQRFPADSRPQDVAMAKNIMSDRNMIPMMRDMLAGTARQMAAADQPFDIEQMFEQVQMGAPRGRSSKPKEVVPVDPTIKTLDCKTLNARLREVDKTIDKKIDEVEAKQTALDSKIDAGNAANAAVQSAGAQACNAGLLGCLASAVTNRIAAPALDAQAMSNAAAINEQRDSREAFNPLLRERTTIVYYAARKSCN